MVLVVLFFCNLIYNNEIVDLCNWYIRNKILIEFSYSFGENLMVLNGYNSKIW